MKKSSQLAVISLLFTWGLVFATENEQIHHYKFVLYSHQDLRNTSMNAVSTQRLLQDQYRANIVPRLGGKFGAVTTEVFSFANVYLSMLWSHEFGHKLRAKQVGGEFRIHNVAIPIPYTTMHLPDSISLVDEALSVTAGFEVNYMNVRSIQSDFIRFNGVSNEDLNFSFANRLMYPLYASVIVPIDPEDPAVWINTAGDPVHTTLPVFKNWSEDPVILEDGTVNPDLVSYYGETVMLSSLFNFLDPQFYRELGAVFGSKEKSRKPTFLIGDQSNGWTYGTLFSISPLGYELYMNNYIHVNENQFALYIKYGQPFKNNGMGLVWNEMIITDQFSASAAVDVWDQDLFGMGASADLDLRIRLKQGLGLVLNGGYKSEGYVLGRPIEAGLTGGLGVDFDLHY